MAAADDPEVEAALDEVARHTSLLRVLGSYRAAAEPGLSRPDGLGAPASMRRMAVPASRAASTLARHRRGDPRRDVSALLVAGVGFASCVRPPVRPGERRRCRRRAASRRPGRSTRSSRASRRSAATSPAPTTARARCPPTPSSGGASPRQKMCRTSIVGLDSSEWCGTGWTGQPNVIQNADGTVEVREGAYDGKYHFVDGTTGRADAAGPGDAATSRRARRPRTPTATPSTTRARATTTSAWSRSIGRNPRCSGS